MTNSLLFLIAGILLADHFGATGTDWAFLTLAYFANVLCLIVERVNGILDGILDAKKKAAA